MIRAYDSDTDHYICWFDDYVENEEIEEEMTRREYEPGEYYILHGVRKEIYIYDD